MPRYFYDPNIAYDEYKDLLINSRTGLNMSQSEFDELDKVVSDGVKKGK